MFFIKRFKKNQANRVTFLQVVLSFQKPATRILT
jgi:hypothetical protein